MSAISKVGVLGVGRMGEPIAKRLAAASYTLRAFDLDPAKAASIGGGVFAAGTPEEAVSGVDVVVAALPTPRAMRDVMFGPERLLADWPTGRALLDMGTGDPELARELASSLIERGGEYLEAPVSGGAAGAAAGTLTVIAAGEKKTFERLQPLLKTLSGKLFYVGSAGVGHQLKLANNLMLAVQVVAVCEAWNIVRNSGIEPTLAYTVLSNCSARSAALFSRVPEAGLNAAGPPSNNFAPGLTVSLMLKDLQLARKLLELAGSRSPVLDAATAEYQQAESSGIGDRDISVVCRGLEERPQS